MTNNHNSSASVRPWINFILLEVNRLHTEVSGRLLGQKTPYDNRSIDVFIRDLQYKLDVSGYPVPTNQLSNSDGFGSVGLTKGTLRVYKMETRTFTNLVIMDLNSRYPIGNYTYTVPRFFRTDIDLSVYDYTFPFVGILYFSFSTFTNLKTEIRQKYLRPMFSKGFSKEIRIFFKGKNGIRSDSTKNNEQ